MEKEALDRAMLALGPLKDDPQGQRMSRSGAEACVREIAEWYVDELLLVNASPRPKKVMEQLQHIAEKAAELKKAMLEASDQARVTVLLTCAAILTSQDPEWLRVFETADGPDLPEKASVNGKPDGSARWFAKLNALESIYRRASEDPKLNDRGGPSLRLCSRWVGTPNYQLVCRCMALLNACGKNFGSHSAEGPLVKLLSAVAGKDKSTLTTFLNDIAEVVDNPTAKEMQQFYAAIWIHSDLSKRRPESHPDLQKARVHRNECIPVGKPYPTEK
jgi:hypothetical protein